MSNFDVTAVSKAIAEALYRADATDAPEMIPVIAAVLNEATGKAEETL